MFQFIPFYICGVHVEWNVDGQKKGDGLGLTEPRPKLGPNDSMCPQVR